MEARGRCAADFSLVLQGPIGRVMDPAREAYESYKPFNASDVSAAVKAREITIAVVVHNGRRVRILYRRLKRSEDVDRIQRLMIDRWSRWWNGFHWLAGWDMRVDLVVSDERFRDQARRAWDAFRQAILPLTFDELGPDLRINVDRNMPMAPRASATGAWVPPGAVAPEYAEFCLADACFGLDQGLTTILLHEAVHVRLGRTRLIENYRSIRRWPRFPNAVNQFELDRDNLAWEVLTFAQEVGVDKFLATANYPTALRERYFRERAHYYRNGEGHRYDDARSPALAIFRLFYGLLRTELGLLVMTDQTERARLQTLQAERDQELQREAGQDLEWFRGVRQRLLAITVDTGDPDRDPYRELSDRIMAMADGEARAD